MGNKEIILYADDEPNMRNLVKDILELDFPAYNIEVFGDGSSLEERLMKGTENVGLVVTDNEMPGIIGSEIIKKYSKRPGFENIPFVLCYAGNVSLGAYLVKEGYAFSYLEKPFGIKDLRRTLKNALASVKDPTASSQ
ncbi:MAG: response regulator [Nanoarchaeota archaeon]